MTTTLPTYARLPINRCNLPAVILGSLTFQCHPTAIFLDGVNELHSRLFAALDSLDGPVQRAENFTDYMRSAFLLDHPDEAGIQHSQKRFRREKADYLRLLRGWFFNPDGLEAAVLKGWVESRFGLIARNHNGVLRQDNPESYQSYQHARSIGLYNSNALEAQVDLLYSYCQYELSRRRPEQSQVTLYRGTNHLDEYESLAIGHERDSILLLNNLNSFSIDRERADEFGDYIMEAVVPTAKLLYFPGLLSAIPQSELEYLVIGGVYRIRIHRY